ncbi:hypothetical protein E7744_14070 [Citricoccus sp. SGAir0253]|uniref:HtaA domain-containing protein n=1 Tax=Citricoccus sp. SGAir0253 TaxID=2567881 RepID=UPI0010CCD6A9|nr:HtaA domain-containing protein [Citricoccus sp. SGAir0253]QCU79133.1 hypothetical protein E7744_14070 [Citricoccus sp. SGAir0253]
MTATAAPSATGTGAVAGAPRGLAWAFHEGFAAYVSRLPDGRIDAEDGAAVLPDGRISFPSAAAAGAVAEGGKADGASDGREPDGMAATAAGEPVLRCRGSVHFTGHHGLLALTLAAPALEARHVPDARPTPAAGPVLTIDDPFEPGTRLVLAELGEAVRSGPVLTYPAPRLTEAGADLFLGHYREGTPLAPLAVHLAAPADTRPQPTLRPTPRPTPRPIPDQDA